MIENMIEEQNKLYAKLTETFSDKKQFKLLNELLDVEVELSLWEGK